MATQRGYITKNHDPSIDADGLVKARDNGVIGKAKNRQGPEPYIDFLLEGYWIITEAELQEYRQLKKQHVSKQSNHSGESN